MRTRVLVVSLGLASLLPLLGVAPGATAADSNTLIIALDTLGAQVMDPIADTRALPPAERRRHVEARFSVSVMTDRYERLYRRLAAERRVPARA